jgi:hypothetical protein
MFNILLPTKSTKKWHFFVFLFRQQMPQTINSAAKLLYQTDKTCHKLKKCKKMQKNALDQRKQQWELISLTQN